MIFARSSRYQRIVVTQAQGEMRLFLNGDLQFSSLDEYRYHEALVHPGLAAVASPRQVLVLGGGGMACAGSTRSTDYWPRGHPMRQRTPDETTA